jgi:hypothetical protein
MTTEAQVVANRSNAQKSTGPRTPEGKAKVAQNAVKHGLLARAAVLQGEDEGAYLMFCDELLGSLLPVGTMERVLADRIVNLTWRLERAERSQNAALETLYDRHTARAAPGPVPVPGRDQGVVAGGNPTLGRVLVEDFEGAKVLERMLVYERRIENSLYRTMGEFRRLQKDRQAESKAAALAREKLDWRSGYSPAPPPNWATLGRRADESDPDAWEQPMRQTKPISGEAPGEPRQVSNKQSQCGADQSAANVGSHKGLGEEEGTEPRPEQSRNDGAAVPHDPTGSRGERRETACPCLV